MLDLHKFMKLAIFLKLRMFHSLAFSMMIRLTSLQRKLRSIYYPWG